MSDLIDVWELAAISGYSRRRLLELERGDRTFPRRAGIGKHVEYRRADAMAWVDRIRPRDYLTRQEFAAMARCSVSHIDRLRKKRPTGFPNEYRPTVGRKSLFKRTEIVAFLEQSPLW